MVRSTRIFVRIVSLLLVVGFVSTSSAQPPRLASLTLDYGGVGREPTLRVGFTEPVMASPSAVMARGMAGQVYAVDIAVSTVSDAFAITLPPSSLGDRVRVVLQANEIVDADGRALDGELFGSPLYFPSGDGFAGGNAVVVFDVLPGDVNRSGTVDAADLAAIRERIGICLGHPQFDLAYDLFADGCIDRADYRIANDHRGLSGVVTDGIAPTIVARTPNPGSLFRGTGVRDVEVQFSEPVSSARSPSALTVVTPSGDLVVAQSFANAPPDRWRFRFDPPLDETGTYRLLLSPEVIDPTGEPIASTPGLAWSFAVDDSPARIASSSPVHQETGVALTRETIIRFSSPLELALFDPAAITATFAGAPLDAWVRLSGDRRRVTLFYANPLPASALVRVEVDGDGLTDDLGQLVDADGDGLPGGTGVIDFQTLSITTLPGTRVCGRVFASELADDVNVPLEGVTISVDGAASTLFATTDRMGNFCLDPAPVGRFFVHIDGSTATNPEIPVGSYYPSVGKPFVSVAGQEVTIGDVYLPRVIDGTLVPVSDTDVTSISFPAAVIADHPEFAGVQIDVPAGSLFADDQTLGGSVGIAPVDPERLPGSLPPDLQFPLVITVQTGAAAPGGMRPTNFDTPAPIRFPNLPHPDTGVVAAPGEAMSLFSFDHDSGTWAIVGEATVTDDGLYVETNPGVGILAPGWHGVGFGCDPQDPCPDDSCDDPSGGVSCAATVAIGAVDCAASFLLVGGIGSCAVGFTAAGASSLVSCHDGLSWSCVGSSALSFGSAAASCALRNTPIVGQVLACGGAVIGAVSSCQCVVSSVGPPMVPEGVIILGTYVQYASAIESLSLAILGSPVWTTAVDATQPGVDPVNDTLEVAAIFDAAAQAQQPGSAMGDRITAAEAATILSLPRPDTIGEADVVELIDYLDLTAEMWAAGTPTHASAGRTGFCDADQLRAAIDQLSLAIAALQDLGETEISLGAGFARALDELLNEITAEVELDYERTFFVMTDETNQVVTRGNLTGGGDFPIASIPGGAFFRCRFYDPVTDHYGGMVMSTDPALASIPIPPPILLKMDGGIVDSDRDDLEDIVEFVIGTDPDDPDTDGDGVSDGAEVEQGTDPLDGILIGTGLIASADTPGTAFDIATGDGLVAVADGTGGVSVFNVFGGMNPTIVAQIPTPNARAIALADPIVAVADGNTGLVVIDIEDPPAAAILYTIDPVQLGGVPRGIDLAAGVAYVGTNVGELVAVDLASGVIIGRIPIGAAIDDVVVNGTWIYVLTRDQLLTIPYLDLPLQVVGTVNSPPTGLGTEPRRRLFVANGVAYAVHRSGYRTHDVTNPAAPLLVTTGDGGTSLQLNWKQIVANGSGRGIATLSPFTGSLPANHNIHLFDLTDPFSPTTTIADRFLFTHVTPGLARAARIYNGLAYVADNTAGLQVVNYEAQDTLGVPPDVDVATSIVGGALTEGQTYIVDVTVEDDVEVRNVQLFLDGTRVATDGSYPFQFIRTAPLSSGPGDTLEISVRASDTGGNVSITSPIVVDLVPDVTPPTVVFADPAASDTIASVLLEHFGCVIAFSEPIAPTTIDAASVRIDAAGPDGQLGTADDVAVPTVPSVVHLGSQVVASLAAAPIGPLRLTLDGDLVRDAAGNALDGDDDGQPGGDFVVDFEVFQAAFTKAWVLDTSGNWHDPTGWSGGTLPIATDIVAIDRPTDVTVTIDQPGAVCAEILGDDSLRLTSAGVLTVIGAITLDSEWLLDGGHLIGATARPGPTGGAPRITGNVELEDVTFDVDLVMAAQCEATSSLTIDETLTIVQVGSGIDLRFSGDFELLGNGDVYFDTGTIFTSILSIGTGTLTVGPDLTLRGRSGSVGGSGPVPTGPVEFFGTVHGDEPGSLFVTGDPLTMHGSILATDGIVELAGNWSNLGTITAVAPGTVQLGGEFTAAGLGSVDATAGEIFITGTLEATGDTVLVDASTGSLVLWGGEVVGGSIETADSETLQIRGGSTLTGVTVSGHVRMYSGVNTINAFDGLTVDGLVELNGGGRLRTNGSFTLDGTGTIAIGGGEVSPQTGDLTLESGLSLTVTTGQLGRIPFATTIRSTVTSTSTGSTRVFGAPWLLEGSITKENGVLAFGGTGVNAGLIDLRSTGDGNSSSDFTQSTAGTLRVELAGTASTEFASLTVSGTANLAGELEIALAPGYTPSLGQTFEVVVAPGGLAGTFDTVTGITIGGGLSFDVQYLADRVRLVVVD